MGEFKKKSYPLNFAILRLASTDWYFCVCWAGGMTCPASAVRDGPFPCFPLLSMLFSALTGNTGCVFVHGGGPFWVGGGPNVRRFRECH